MDPTVLAALITAGSQLVGGAMQGIGAAGGRRREEIGNARQAAKLDDLGKMFENYDPSAAFASFDTSGLTRFGNQNAVGRDTSAMRNLAQRLSVGGGVGRVNDNAIRSRMNRELANSSRSIAASMGGVRSGAGQTAMADAQGQVIAQLAEALGNADMQAESLKTQRLGAAGGLFGQAGGLESQDMARRQSAIGQALGLDLQKLTTIENLGMDKRRLQLDTYGHDSFSNPRYNQETGQIDEGK